MKKILPLALPYFAILGVHLYACNVGNVLLQQVSKPLLLILLILYLIGVLRKAGANNFGWSILTGLIFSLSGDIFLLFQEIDGNYFLFGLGSFLIAHILYSIAFTRTYLAHHTIPLLKSQGWVMIAIIGYALYFFSLIKDHLGPMLAPVLIYTLAIAVMLLMAANRYGRVSTRSFWAIAIGAAFFVASDSLLAWNKFVNPLRDGHVLVMLTYGLAQFGIAWGAALQLRHQRAQTAKHAA